MIIAFSDSRSIGIALLHPTSGQFFNPTTRVLDAAFDYKKHVIAPVQTPVTIATQPAPATGQTAAPNPPATLNASIYYADLGTALETYPELVTVLYVLDAQGVPNSVTEVIGNPGVPAVSTSPGFAR